MLKHQKKRAGANAAVESEPQHTLANCSWLGEMRNLRVINTFCWFLYNTDRSRCESAVTSAPKTAGGGVCSVGDASRCWAPLPLDARRVRRRVGFGRQGASARECRGRLLRGRRAP